MAAVRFCSVCGDKLPSSPPVTCARCGTSHWRNPKPCANAIVVADDRVVLVRRAHRESPWYGLWCAPGGFCELGEHPAETAVREAREETGLDVEIMSYLDTWVDVYADEPGDPEAEVINVAYYTATLATDERGRIDPAEVSEVAWFAWDELPEDLAPPGTLEAALREARAATTNPARTRPR